MKMILILAIALTSSNAFRPPISIPRAVLIKTQVSYLSELEDDDKKAEREAAEGGEKPYEKYEREQYGVPQKGALQPENYDSFIDDDGFDGGDGQVGVVGSEDNAMETFDMSQAVGTSNARGRVFDNAIGGTESKMTQKNVFGRSTGYAEELAENEDMVDVDEYGEDRLSARRQQYENWRNQRELKGNQIMELEDMAGVTGQKYDPRSGSSSYFEALNAGTNQDTKEWNMIGGKDATTFSTEAAVGLSKGDITAVIEMTANFPKPAFGEIMVENDVMTFEDFKVGFSPDSDVGDFQITPLAGELARRGGDPTRLAVVFLPQAPGDGTTKHLFVIVETEESKWTYEIRGTVM